MVVKKRKIEDLLIDQLPVTNKYEYSLMHRDEVQHVAINEHLITISKDGILKFWKILERLEFIKAFKVNPVTDYDYHKNRLVTCSKDYIKIFDILNFDMIDMIEIDFQPSKVLIYKDVLLVTQMHSNLIHVFKSSVKLKTLKFRNLIDMKLHPSGVIVSCDTSGMIEYWIPNLELEGPDIKDPKTEVDFEFKSQTDLYDFKKRKLIPNHMQFSHDHSKLAIRASDYIAIYDFRTGKIVTRIQEEVVRQLLEIKLDDMEYGKRLAAEKDVSNQNVIFDTTDSFVLYPTMWGIKIVRVADGELVNVIGSGEGLRFTNITLYQGAPRKKSLVTIEMASSENTVLRESEVIDPLLVCCALGKKRY